MKLSSAPRQADYLPNKVSFHFFFAVLPNELLIIHETLRILHKIIYCPQNNPFGWITFCEYKMHVPQNAAFSFIPPQAPFANLWWHIYMHGQSVNVAPFSVLFFPRFMSKLNLIWKKNAIYSRSRRHERPIISHTKMKKMRKKKKNEHKIHSP